MNMLCTVSFSIIGNYFCCHREVFKAIEMWLISANTKELWNVWIIMANASRRLVLSANNLPNNKKYCAKRKYTNIDAYLCKEIVSWCHLSDFSIDFPWSMFLPQRFVTLTHNFSWAANNARVMKGDSDHVTSLSTVFALATWYKYQNDGKFNLLALHFYFCTQVQTRFSNSLTIVWRFIQTRMIFFLYYYSVVFDWNASKSIIFAKCLHSPRLEYQTITNSNDNWLCYHLKKGNTRFD